MNIALRSKSTIAPKRLSSKSKLQPDKPKAKLKTRPRKITVQFEWETLAIHFGSSTPKITDDEFFRFCMLNQGLRIEMSKDGEIMIMMPTGGEGGNRNFKLNGRIAVWVEDDSTGEGFDSSTVFILPNGAKRSPDFSWIRRERWEALTEKQRQVFPPICPDFVVELRSRTDRLNKLKAKMEEYIENGAQLGWLIDPKEKKVHVYRSNAEVEILDKPKSLSGGKVLKGLKLDLTGILD
ncbi:MAG: Uma2 family endonuclease [Blastocatellia bacterium]